MKKKKSDRAPRKIKELTRDICVSSEQNLGCFFDLLFRIDKRNNLEKDQENQEIKE